MRGRDFRDSELKRHANSFGFLHDFDGLIYQGGKISGSIQFYPRCDVPILIEDFLEAVAGAIREEWPDRTITAKIE
jgi:hypothetical protein